MDATINGLLDTMVTDATSQLLDVLGDNLGTMVGFVIAITAIYFVKKHFFAFTRA